MDLNLYVIQHVCCCGGEKVERARKFW